MGDSNFISEFHNIEGISVGERKKNLQKLLKNKLVNTHETQTILDHLKPKTYLEDIFYVNILIYLKKTNELFDILKNGNEIFVKKIMKEQWFLQEAFNNTSAEEIINDILPATSYSVRMKLLKKLSVLLPEDKVNIMFDLVLKRYGLFIATTVIPGCSPKKIQEIMKSNEVKLWTYQLKIIYNKDPNLINVYLEQHKHEKHETILENSFFMYLAQKNPILFWELIEKFDIKIDLKLGRRTTKKTIMSKKREIIDRPEKYVKYLRLETLVRHLNQQGNFKEVYCKLFPSDIEIFEQEIPLCNRLLKYYPKHDQYRLFSQTFNEVFNEDIWSNTKCLKDYLLDLIDDKQIRIKWAKQKYKENNDDEYMKYYETEQCFNLIKQKINVTSSLKERRKLLCILVKSCAVNKDLKLLERVLEYFCKRHRNDDKSVWNDILNIIKSNFKLQEFNDIHWKYLCEIQSLNKEYNDYSSLRIQYIKYLYENNRPEGEKDYAILEYIKDQIVGYRWSLTGLSELMNSEVEKEIILQALECAPKIMKTQYRKSEKTYVQSGFIAEIFWYNSRHPDQQVNVSKNEKLVKVIREILEANFTSFGIFNMFEKIICKLNRNDFENEVLKYYWEKAFPQFFDHKIFKWFFKYDPLVIVEYFEEIMKDFPGALVKIWSRVRMYTHLNLDKMVITHYLKQLDDDNVADKTNLILPLSLLSTTEDYIRIIEERNFLPTTSKLLLQSEEEKNIYKFQRSFLENSKNIKEPLKFIPILISKFCQGDYIQASLKPLYSLFHKSPENKLITYVDKLSKNSEISVKKHSLFLACLIFDQQMVLQILESFGKNEKNASLQKNTFLSSLKYFSKNPNDMFCQQIYHLMRLLKLDDVESMQVLSTIKISRNYKSSYIQNIWKLLETFKANAQKQELGKLPILMSSILESVDAECIQKLPHDFCKQIIQNNFLINPKSDQSLTGIFAFVTRFVIYRNEKNVNFDFIFKLFANFKSQFWNISQRNVYDFFKYFYGECYKTKISLNNVTHFSREWESIFTPLETFEEYVLLNLLRIKKETEEKPDIYSEKIVLFMEQIEVEYGQIVVLNFIIILSQFLDIKNQEIFNLVFNMLKFKTSILNCICVIQLIILKDDLLYKNKIRFKYQKIDSILREISDPSVQLYYNVCISNK